MTYTELKIRKNKKYYYRVRTIRYGSKFKKERIYLGINLEKEELERMEENADKILLKEKRKKENKELIKLKTKIKKILKKYNIKRAGLFGSYARGEQKKKSDIDLLIMPSKNMGLEFVGLAQELEEKLDRKVDLLTYKSIHPLLKKRILNDEIQIISNDK
jgi:uncharacterized protein